MRRRPLLSLAALLALGTMIASCISPTLPLPPPDHPDAIFQDSTGLWQISGECVAGATVIVFNTNLNPQRGVVYVDNPRAGTYQVTIPGKACDLVWITQESFDGSGDESTETSFVLQAWNGMAVDPNACVPP